MKKAILILNKIELSNVPFWEWFRDTGNALLMICDSQVLDKAHDLGSRFERIIEVDNYEVSGQVEFEALRISKEYRIEDVVAISEVDVIRAARIRDYLNITNKNESDLVLFREKVAMKNMAKRSGVRIPRFEKISNSTDLIRSADLIGFPMVVKPSLYGGSIGFSKAYSMEDLQNIAKRIMLKPDVSFPLIGEEYLESEMVHCDGVFLKGEIIWSLTSNCVNGCLAFKEGLPNGGRTISTKSPVHKKCVEAILKFINSIEPETSFVFHAEFFVISEIEQPIFCEIACRPGGSRIRDMIKKITNGFDIFKIHAMLLARQYDRVLEQIPGSHLFGVYLVLPPRKGILKIHNLPAPSFATDFNWEYNCEFPTGSSTDQAQHSGSELASVVYTVENEENLHEQTTQIKHWLIQNHEICTELECKI